MPEIFLHDNHVYYKNGGDGHATYYRCSKYKTQRCSGRLIRHGDGIIATGTHVCTSGRNNSCAAADDHVQTYLESESKDLKKYPSQIYQGLLTELATKAGDNAVKIPSKTTVYGQIRSLRGPTTESLSGLEREPLSQTLSGGPFLRRLWFGDVDGEYNRFYLWTSDEALAVLRTEGQIFIDATFRVTPAPFCQCLVIMALDAATNTYVPCVWSLMTSRNEYLYCEILHAVVVLLKYKWNPSAVTVDFEAALINAVKYQFPQSRIVGCYFHFQQALFRKMRNLGIDEESASAGCKKLRKLTRVRNTEIQATIDSLKRGTEMGKNCWTPFWNYFSNTWMKKFPSNLWNISWSKDKQEVKRTNNCLERYNRRMGEKFLNAHPNVFSFVSVIREEESHYTNLCRGIRAGTIPFPITNDEFEV